MGEVVGAALVSHVPPLVLPEATRLEMNGGKDFTILEGLHRIRREIDALQPDTIVVLDSHWFTTFEFVVSAHERRAGRFTSEELPRGNPQMPYDLPGDPELAHLVAAVAGEHDQVWVHASEDPCLPVRYATVYLTPFLQRDERWVSFSLCQTAEYEDFVDTGAVLGEAIRRSDRRVVLLASGALSHKFWPLRELRQHESADPVHLRSPEHRAADERLIRMLERGDHAAALDFYPEFRTFSPEGRFGHYLLMASAMGGAGWNWPGRATSEYENAAGTGNIQMWFAPGA